MRQMHIQVMWTAWTRTLQGRTTNTHPVAHSLHNTQTHITTPACSLTHTHREKGASSPELWVKMTQGLVGHSNQAHVNATSDPVLG